MTRLERAVLLLLCIFAVKFVFSTAAHFAAPLQVVDMLGSGRNPVDVWLLLLSCTAALGTFCLYRRAARAIGAKCTKADAAILAVCIAASAAFYLHAMVGRQSLYLWDNATYYNLQVRLESNFADGVFTGVGSTIYKTWFNDSRRSLWHSSCCCRFCTLRFTAVCRTCSVSRSRLCCWRSASGTISASRPPRGLCRWRPLRVCSC